MRPARPSFLASSTHSRGGLVISKSKKQQSAPAMAQAALDPDPPPMTSGEPPRLLSAKQVIDRTGLTYVTIWSRMKAGTFPRAREISPKKLGWLESELNDWIANLPLRRL